MAILVVDSNAVEAERTAAVLRKYLANPVRIARDGPHAFSMLLGSPLQNAQPIPYPQLIFLDAHAHLADPEPFLGRLRLEPRTKHVPLVVLTRSDAETRALRRRLRDECAYVSKPLSLERLADALHQVRAKWLLMHEQPNLQEMVRLKDPPAPSEV